MSVARALAAALSIALLCPAAAHAGAQVYEELAQSVRTRLSAAIADRSVPELAFRDRDNGHQWIMEMSRRLEKRIADRKERIDLLRTVRRNGSKITIVVFSGHAHPEMIRHTLAAGADAYVPKSGDYEMLLDAIRDKRATSNV